MGDVKQVKVDNWGIFFLQRLQHFYKKHYFCDLTLQFDDNVQLKVHRLVINACTEYFQMLEQSCEVNNDCLKMPPEMCADVVVPIVNFMYSGILEFQESTFNRLYSTAQIMNISVLTKLLEAQRVPIPPLAKTNKRASMPITWNLQGKKIAPKTIDPDLPEPLPGRKLPIWRRKSVPAVVDDVPKPTRFEWPEEEDLDNNHFGSSFDEISYTSRPLVLPTLEKSKPQPCSSNFEEIRKTAASLKRSASPVGNRPKKVNIQDVKEYLKEQKLRSDYIEYDDAEGMDNDLQTYDYDSNDEQNIEESPSKGILKGESTSSSIAGKHVRFNLEDKKDEVPSSSDKGNTTDMSNHTKIITEVLKKYPHLVKKNKNIRLKILAKGNNKKVLQPIKTIAKPQTPKKVAYMVKKEEKPLIQQSDKGPFVCDRCSPRIILESYYLYRKHLTDEHNEKMDSKMCDMCGHTSHKQNMLVFHKYIKHGIQPPAMYSFPSCDLCPYIALSPTMLVKHKLSHNGGNLTCESCNKSFATKAIFLNHIQTCNQAKTYYECNDCHLKFTAEENLINHITSKHTKKETKQSEEENDLLLNLKKDKIKIISDVKVRKPVADALVPISTASAEKPLEPSSEAEALSNVASGIAASLGLVDTVVILEDNQYILRPQGQQNVQEYILPQIMDSSESPSSLTSKDTNITSTDELVMVLTNDHDYGDNSQNMSSENQNIVVLYSHPVQNDSEINSQLNSDLNSQLNPQINSQINQHLNSQISNNSQINSQINSQFIQQEMMITSDIEIMQDNYNSHNNETREVLQSNFNQNDNIQDAVQQEANKQSEMDVEESIERIQEELNKNTIGTEYNSELSDVPVGMPEYVDDETEKDEEIVGPEGIIIVNEDSEDDITSDNKTENLQNSKVTQNSETLQNSEPLSNIESLQNESSQNSQTLPNEDTVQPETLQNIESIENSGVLEHTETLQNIESIKDPESLQDVSSLENSTSLQNIESLPTSESLQNNQPLEVSKSLEEVQSSQVSEPTENIQSSQISESIQITEPLEISQTSKSSEDIQSLQTSEQLNQPSESSENIQVQPASESLDNIESLQESTSSQNNQPLEISEPQNTNNIQQNANIIEVIKEYCSESQKNSQSIEEIDEKPFDIEAMEVDIAENINPELQVENNSCIENDQSNNLQKMECESASDSASLKAEYEKTNESVSQKSEDSIQTIEDSPKKESTPQTTDDVESSFDSSKKPEQSNVNELQELELVDKTDKSEKQTEDKIKTFSKNDEPIKSELVKIVISEDTNSKISNLLQDWDDGDTDSQQSDIKPTDTDNDQTSINKLIDDWEEEEDG